MEITKVEEVKPYKDPETEEITDKVVNIVVGHTDHRGKIRHHTIDELRAMKKNIDEVIKEFDK